MKQSINQSINIRLIKVVRRNLKQLKYWQCVVILVSQQISELQSSDIPELPFPTDLLCRSYHSVRTAVGHCE